MTIKTWEDREKESTEEFMDLPLEVTHFMKREIADLRIAAAKYERLAHLVSQLDPWRSCMSYNDSYFGEPPGHLKSTIRQMSHTVWQPGSAAE